MKVKLYNDGYNEIVFNPSTKKVIIGINIMSHFGSRYRSFKAKTEEEAVKIGTVYINQNSKVKVNAQEFKNLQL